MRGRQSLQPSCVLGLHSPEILTLTNIALFGVPVFSGVTRKNDGRQFGEVIKWLAEEATIYSWGGNNAYLHGPARACRRFRCGYRRGTS
ncbi:hypothetical protein AGR7C_Lc220120 [Agrobacterium deltaense Zutra 3/1]|uniref:Uncharacterized protein n=1 Tax=Agrobacterium deltaense Zutra 3/1 TaxID=1183427 RepID=A0A1S7RU90_9HYPH|nr:hypothetical protein AGR7C_Lc220120 [Agrobacterium deltaense Zutra 3/1]